MIEKPKRVNSALEKIKLVVYTGAAAVLWGATIADVLIPTKQAVELSPFLYFTIPLALFATYGGVKAVNKIKPQ